MDYPFPRMRGLFLLYIHYSVLTGLRVQAVHVLALTSANFAIGRFASINIYLVHNMGSIY